MVIFKVIVKRNGELKEILFEYVVLGDIVMFDVGWYILCDLCFIEIVNLKVEEFVLIGEFVFVDKDVIYYFFMWSDE